MLSTCRLVPRAFRPAAASRSLVARGGGTAPASSTGTSKTSSLADDGSAWTNSQDIRRRSFSRERGCDHSGGHRGLQDARGSGILRSSLIRTTAGEILREKGRDDVGDWVWCETGDTVRYAAEKMLAANCGSIVVFNKILVDTNNDGIISHSELSNASASDCISGILTERDYLRKIIVHGRSSSDTVVADVMTHKNDMFTVCPDTSILKAMRLMTDISVRHIPVVNKKHDRLMGMLSIGDLVKVIMEEQGDDIDHMREYINQEVMYGGGGPSTNETAEQEAERGAERKAAGSAFAASSGAPRRSVVWGPLAEVLRGGQGPAGAN